MPGMNDGLDINDPTVVAAFRSALLHQGIAAVLIFAVLAVAWVAVREWRMPAGSGSAGAGTAAGGRVGTAAAGDPEPSWRQVLRIGFGLLWLFDGILQAQPGMAVGLPSQVIEPSATSSPLWVQHLVNWAGTAWSYHPVQAGAAAVWIQVGIGLWLLLAARGPLSRLAGLAGAAWGLIVWVFGESFGGVLAPGLSWLTGAPGGAAFYVVAGALVALPVRYWRSPQFGRLLAGGTGLFLAGMAVLQAWPGRGFWQGSFRGQPGSLTSMIQSMATTSQPSALASLVSGFGDFVRAHGFAVNLFTVAALAVLGAGFAAAAITAGPRQRQRARLRQGLIRWSVIALAAVCLADWVLVQDFGFLGGLGTDPNSMIPMALLAVGAGLALARGTATAPALDPVLDTAGGTAPDLAGGPVSDPALDPAGGPGPDPAAGTAGRPDPALDPAGGDPAPAPRPGRQPAGRPRLTAGQLRPAVLSRSLAAASLRTVLSASAIGVIILGAIPMAAAQASSAAAPILAEAIDGSSAPLNATAPAFTLTDQNGRAVSLASLHGKAVLLTFLDPVCVTQCPLEAQEFRQAGQLLGADARKVELVAVNLNPLYSSTAYTQAFDRQERLAGVPNWLFLTGSPAQLQPVWRHYGQASQTLPAGSMLGHSDSAFVISPSGRMREELDFDPGPGTAATVSSFATELATAARRALAAQRQQSTP
jgi:cytochrome oxidase Cu insertion factor (SCO1/SenC/PrrC family)